MPGTAPLDTLDAMAFPGENMPVILKLLGFVVILLALLTFGFYIFGIYEIR